MFSFKLKQKKKSDPSNRSKAKIDNGNEVWHPTLYRIIFSSQTHSFCWLKANVWMQTSAPPVAIRSWQPGNHVLQFWSICHSFGLFLTPHYTKVSGCRWATKFIYNSGLLGMGQGNRFRGKRNLFTRLLLETLDRCMYRGFRNTGKVHVQRI